MLLIYYSMYVTYPTKRLVGKLVNIIIVKLLIVLNRYLFKMQILWTFHQSSLKFGHCHDELGMLP